MTDHRIVSREAWQAERDELLKEEKELTRRGDELARSGASCRGFRSRRTTVRDRDGHEGLADLFDGRSQLLVYHFMFGPSYEAAARSAPRSQTRSHRRCPT
jgi:predicted dithiol-disulfide oxidoreductase (DUF899 family)